MDKPKLLNIPNVLTFIRILLVPVFVSAYFKLPDNRSAALGIFIIASITDALDGFIARHWNQITWLGKLFDPLADKLMTVSMLYCLAYTGYIGWWVLIVIIAKELYMIAGASFMFSQNYVVKSAILGKISTVGLVISLCLVYPWHSVDWLYTAGIVLLYMSLAISIAASIQYTINAVKKRYEFKSN